MAGEYLLVNPRRRHRRKKSRARKTTTRRRRRRHVARVNPYRHRRTRARYGRLKFPRRRRRSRVHRNPGLGIGRGAVGVLMTGAGIGAGAIGTNLATGWLSKHLPTNLQTGIGNTAVKAGVGLVLLPLVLRFVPGGKRFVRPVMIGAGVAVLFDLWTAYAEAPVKKALGLADYQPGYLSDYHAGQLAGDLSVDANLSGTIYEGGVYD